MSIDDRMDRACDALASGAFWLRRLRDVLLAVLIFIVACATPWPEPKPVFDANTDYVPYPQTQSK